MRGLFNDELKFRIGKFTEKFYNQKQKKLGKVEEEREGGYKVVTTSKLQIFVSSICFQYLISATIFETFNEINI